jgi:hypothetical protein
MNDACVAALALAEALIARLQRDGELSATDVEAILDGAIERIRANRRTDPEAAEVPGSMETSRRG